MRLIATNNQHLFCCHTSRCSSASPHLSHTRTFTRPLRLLLHIWMRLFVRLSVSVHASLSAFCVSLNLSYALCLFPHISVATYISYCVNSSLSLCVPLSCLCFSVHLTSASPAPENILDDIQNGKRLPSI